MDLELYPTVLDIIERADNPKNLFISVFSQDDDHPNLEEIFEKYGIPYSYRKTETNSARGAGFARYMTREALDISDYRYYMQIDSHMRFDQGWDTFLLKQYEDLHKVWGKFLISTYPPSYEYEEDGSIKYIQSDGPPCVKLVKIDEYLQFEPKYIPYDGGNYGKETGYFCAGYVFGRTEYFDAIKHDPLIYFNGEEHLMSIRYHQKDIKIVCPPYVPVYHDYEGVNRKRVWEVNPERASLEEMSRKRVLQFYLGQLDDAEFGITDTLKFAAFFINFVEIEESA